MKRLNSICLALIFLLVLSSFDWKPAPNAVLRDQMLSYATSALTQIHHREVQREIKRFIKKENRSTDSLSWINETIVLTQRLKTLCPPEVSQDPQNSTRRQILELLDYPLHFNNYGAEDHTAFNTAIQNYICTARESVISQLAQERPDKGLQLWKLYNMGFIFRSATHTVAIDIAAPNHLPLRQEECERIVEQIDVLFLTHPHSDHYSKELLCAMEAAGKPIVLPCPLSFTNHFTQAIVLESDHKEPIEIAGIGVQNFMGNQGQNIPNNVYVLDIDGMRVLHSGDNYVQEAFAPLAQIPAAHLIIAATWNKIQNHLPYAMANADPNRQIFIPSHENELSHSVDHRESFHEMFQRQDRLGNPDFNYPRVLLMDIGESFHLTF